MDTSTEDTMNTGTNNIPTAQSAQREESPKGEQADVLRGGTALTRASERQKPEAKPVKETSK